MNDEAVMPMERGKMMLKWRTTLGWTSAEVAKRLGVTGRTVTSDESGGQPVPESRWRLFVHEVLAEINTERRPEMVVVTSRESFPLDVVSSDNYAGYALAENGVSGMIASYSVNRLSGAPEVHRQLFPLEGNEHVIRAINRWEAARQEETPNRAAFEMQRWLMRRILKGELANPELTPLKAAVNDARARLDQSEPSSDNYSNLTRALDMAITALMEEVARTAAE